jgi:hypothetical protein
MLADDRKVTVFANETLALEAFKTADWAGTILMFPNPIGMAFSIQENSSLSIATLLALVFRPLKFWMTA